MAGPQPAPELSDFPMVVDKDKGSIEVKDVKKSSWVTVTQVVLF